MARFSSFLGRRVEVQYRASDTLLPASGIFVADSGRSIFLEQSFEQRGQHRHFRWEIPYQHLVRIGLIVEDEEERRLPSNASRTAASERALDREAPASDSSPSGLEIAAPDPPPQTPPKDKLAVSAAAGMGLVAAVLPLANRSKTA